MVCVVTCWVMLKHWRKKRQIKRARFHTGSSVPVHRMSIVTMFSIELILKASSEIIAHSLGRTIWLGKQKRKKGVCVCGDAGRAGRLKAPECSTTCQSKGRAHSVLRTLQSEFQMHLVKGNDRRGSRINGWRPADWNRQICQEKWALMMLRLKRRYVKTSRTSGLP